MNRDSRRTKRVAGGGSSPVRQRRRRPPPRRQEAAPIAALLFTLLESRSADEYRGVVALNPPPLPPSAQIHRLLHHPDGVIEFVALTPLSFRGRTGDRKMAKMGRVGLAIVCAWQCVEGFGVLRSLPRRAQGTKAVGISAPPAPVARWRCSTNEQGRASTQATTATGSDGGASMFW